MGYFFCSCLVLEALKKDAQFYRISGLTVYYRGNNPDDC
jgi:hypothetical protein